MLQDEPTPQVQRFVTSLNLVHKSVFKAGRLRHFYQQWKNITSDFQVLQAILGYKLKFWKLPWFTKQCREIQFSEFDKLLIDEQISTFLEREIIQKCYTHPAQFLSNIFFTKKSDNSIRIILNLKNLNDSILYQHFKMETLHFAMELIYPGCIFTSIDLRDAYYSVSVSQPDRIFLRFTWRDQLYQFCALPMGLASSPQIFTKVCKVVLTHLRKLNVTIVGYIDDLLIISKNQQESEKDIRLVIQVFQYLGFIINENKSVFTGTTKIKFLGFWLDSMAMKVTLTIKRASKLKNQCVYVLHHDKPLIRDVARVLGLIQSAIPATIYGKLHFRNLEFNKTAALQRSQGDFDVPMKINELAKQELVWWITNVFQSFGKIYVESPNTIVAVDASMEGWGMFHNGETYGDRWASHELLVFQTINILELLAAKYAVIKMSPQYKNSHIRIASDSTTAIAYINKMGGKKQHLNALAKSLWTLAIENNIWLSAQHIPGKINPADVPSRHFTNYDLEWQLDPEIFRTLCNMWGMPTIDLFASRDNTQLPRFMSWNFDVNAENINAFLHTWSGEFPYIFPPFILVGKCLQKLQMDQVEKAILIYPDWPSQPWYTVIRRLAMGPPKPIKVMPGTLRLPQSPHQVHALYPHLKLSAVLLSGMPQF